MPFPSRSDHDRFDPNQPRIPKGQDGAGRWTDDVLRRHAAAPLAVPFAAGATAAAAALWQVYQQLSKRNSSYERAIIALPIRREKDRIEIDAPDVRVLRRPDEVRKFCEKYADVQQRLDGIVDEYSFGSSGSRVGDLVDFRAPAACM